VQGVECYGKWRKKVTVKIRKLKGEDALKIRELMHHYDRPIPERAIRLSSSKGWMCHLAKQELSFVAEADGKVVGFVSGNFIPRSAQDSSSLTLTNPGGEILVGDLVVHRDYRGKGIATSLLLHVKESGLSKGITKLVGYVDSDNRPALKLYRKLGFQLKEVGLNLMVFKT